MSVGLDIGSKTIKIVELAKEGDSWKLVASGIAGFKGQQPMHANDDKELADIAAAVKKLHKEAGISGKEIAISLPESQVFTRTIKFPLLTDQEIESAIKWEAEQYIPIPLNEAIIQHQILERREQSAPPEVVVLLVAAPRTLVEKYTKAVQLAGLNPIGVETELLSMVRSLAPGKGVTMLIDFGAGSTDIAIAKDGKLSFSRSIPTAGEAFTRAVAQNLGVAYQQAEEYKKAYGLSEGQLEGKIKGALGPVFRMVSDEIKKAIHYYQTEEKGEVPASVVISGGTAGMPETLSSLSKLLGLEVIIGNPFAGISVDPEVAKSIEPYAPLYSIAVGLAKRED
jgi:type IV pilus assembly protein PilM